MAGAADRLTGIVAAAVRADARRCAEQLGATVPMRFHAGEPFHAGLAWQAMDVGLKGMSAVLAD